MAVSSPSAKRRADEQESDTRLSSRVEQAHDCDDHESALYSKSGGCVVTVHALIRGDLLYVQFVVRQLIGRSWGVSMERRYRELRRYVVGWLNYFALSEYYRPIPELDEWLRRRLRTCYWKQWRWPRTKISHLVSLGISLKQAIMTGVSSKGPYCMSRTKVTQMAMSNQWLKEQGLVSINDQWSRFHYPASTA